MHFLCVGGQPDGVFAPAVLTRGSSSESEAPLLTGMAHKDSLN